MGDSYVDHVIVYRDKSRQWRWRAVEAETPVEVTDGPA